MLNKKKVVLFIGVPIIIILLLVIVFVVSNSGGAKLAKTYDKLTKADAYLFEMKDSSGYEITIAKKNGATCINMNSEEEKVTTLVKDNVTYVISHSHKEYRVYNAEVAGETVVTDMLGNLKDAKYNTGKEKINDKNYQYEEFEKFAGFLTSTSIDINEENSKTRFYFDGNDLKYIKTIPSEGEQELLDVHISYNAPDELFEIPSDYEKKEDTAY